MGFLFKIVQWGAKIRPDDPFVASNAGDLWDMADAICQSLGLF